MQPEKPLAWITGSGGLIGNYLVQTAPQYAGSWRVLGLIRSQLELCDFAAVRGLFRQQKPQLVIHCAALSRSTECQAHPNVAWKNNVETTACLAELAADIPFFFFSTDLVFDGKQGLYDETAAPNPLSVYAETKVAAEKLVFAHPQHTVIRTSLNGGTSPGGDRAFNEELRRAWQAGKKPKLFVDEFRSPIPAGLTAQAVWALVSARRPGLYHVAGRSRLSRYRIGELVAARWPSLQPQLEAGSLRDYTGQARPPDTSLNCAKAQALLPFTLCGLDEWLADHPAEKF